MRLQGFIAAFDQHAVVNQEIQMRLYSRIYKYHLQVRLFVLAALVYAKSLKNIKILKHRQSCVKATLMKSHEGANNGDNNRSGGGQGSSDGANQKIHEDNERVLSNARNQTM